MTTSSKVDLFKHEALLVSAITLWGYLLTYVYEIGNLQYYDIPLVFLRLDVLGVVLGLIALTITAGLILFVGFLLGTHLQKTFFSVFIRIYAIILLVFYIIQFSTGFDLSSGITGIILCFIFSLFFTFDLRRDIKNIHKPITIMDSIRGVILPIIISLPFSYLAAFSVASKRITYPIINGDQIMILIQMNDNFFIAKPIIENKIDMKRTIVLSPDNISEIGMQPIGPIDRYGNLK